MNWISVKERLPDEKGLYLVYGKAVDDEGNTTIATRIFHICSSQDGFHRRDFVGTHWMPLPKPPEERKTRHAGMVFGKVAILLENATQEELERFREGMSANWLIRQWHRGLPKGEADADQP